VKVSKSTLAGLLGFAAAVSALSGSEYAPEPIKLRERPMKIYGQKCPACGVTGKTLYWNGAKYVCHKCEIDVAR
jgi:hypothetical protein